MSPYFKIFGVKSAPKSTSKYDLKNDKIFPGFKCDAQSWLELEWLWSLEREVHSRFISIVIFSV